MRDVAIEPEGVSTWRNGAAHVVFDHTNRLGPYIVVTFVAHSHTPHDCCVRFTSVVAEGRATLAARRPATALPGPDLHRLDRTSLTWRTGNYDSVVYGWALTRASAELNESKGIEQSCWRGTDLTVGAILLIDRTRQVNGRIGLASALERTPDVVLSPERINLNQHRLVGTAESVLALRALDVTWLPAPGSS